MKKILITFLILFLPILSFAQESSNPIVEFTEEDASPSTYPYKVKFPNSSVTDNLDGTASISFTGALDTIYLQLSGSNQSSWTPTTTLVTNLNADLWDGYQFSDYLDQDVKTTSSPTFANLTDSGLTTTRIPYASTGGLLIDNASLTTYSATAGTGNTVEIDVNELGESGTPIAGLLLANTTPAAGSTNQNSPALIFQGQGTGDTNETHMTRWFYVPDGTGGSYGQLKASSKIGSTVREIFALDTYGQWKLAINYNSSIITDLTSPTAGLQCTADGTATAVLDRASPSLRFYAPVWKTAATAASQQMTFQYENVGEQGITSPIGAHILYYGTNSQSGTRTNESLRYEWGDNFAIGMLGVKTPQANSVQINGDLLLADEDTVGAEKLTNGTFTGSAAGWTLGTGWTYNTNLVRKDTDGVGTLSQTSAAMATPLVAGETYILSFVISSNTVTDGSMVVTCGGATRRNLTTNNGTYAWTFTATTTDDLVFTPSLTTSRFYIDTISLKKITGGDANLLGNVTIGGNTTIATGSNFTIGTTQWNSGDSIDGTKVANADLGEISVSSGVWSVDSGSILLSELGGGAAGANAYDFGGATSLEIPNGANPTVDADGEIAYDTNDENISVYDGSASRAINTVIHIEKAVLFPEYVQPDIDDIELLDVNSSWAPFGIKLVNVGIKTNASSSYTVAFQEWTDATTFSSTIESVATVTSTEANTSGASIDDSDIASGNIIKCDLPTTTGVVELVVFADYWIKTGN